MCMYAYINRYACKTRVLGHAPPGNLCSEITSEAILGQKQYMARGVLHPLSMYVFAS